MTRTVSIAGPNRRPVPDPASVAEMRRVLAADFARILHQTTGGKPTSRLRSLMHLTLPAMQVAILHRFAHLLHGRGWRRCAALVSGLSLRLTGASLHPGSAIGPGMLVPHPARVVFCGNAGSDLVLLPGTLVGPRDWVFPNQPFPEDAPRFGDGAIVGAHAAVQGAVTVGAGATIGIGVCTLRDVPAGTVTMLAQRQIRSSPARPAEFKHPDPDRQRLEGTGAPELPRALPPPSAGEGGPAVRPGREWGTPLPEVAEPACRPALGSAPSLPSPDTCQGPPSPVEGGGRARGAIAASFPREWVTPVAESPRGGDAS